MGKAQKWLVLLLGMVSLHAQVFRALPAPAALGNREFISENEKFHLTLEFALTNLNVSGPQAWTAKMFRRDGNPPTLLWRQDFLDANLATAGESDIHVSDDGAFFLITLPMRDWTLVHKEHPPRRFPQSARPSGGSQYSNEDRIAELDRYNEEPIVRVWTRDKDQWTAYRVPTLDAIQPTSGDTTRWNEATRQKILAGIARLKNDQLRGKLADVSPKLSQLAKSAMPASKQGEVAEIHFHFLTKRRDPRDRPLFEELIARPLVDPSPPGWPANNPLGGQVYYRFLNSGTFVRWGGQNSFRSEHGTRARGDRLLALFDKNPEAIALEKNNPQASKLFYLGAIDGTVDFPVPVMRKISTLRIFLAPEKSAGKTWSPEVIEKIEGPLSPYSTNIFEMPDYVSFQFETVSPGRYMLKAIWDKRPGFADTNQAGPGDYESPWVPIEIAAGGRAIVSIPCTNRVDGAESYYAADQLALQQWRKDGKELLLQKTVAQKNRRELHAVPIEDWLVKTNVSPRNKQHGLTRISLLEAPAPHNPKSLPRPPQLIIVARKNKFVEGPPAVNPEYLRILDEHGCSFSPTDVRHTTQTAIYTFTQFPRAAKTFRLVAYGPGRKSDVLYDYSMTNPFPTNQFPSTAQPFPLQLKMGAIEMTVKKVSSGGLNGWMDCSFFENGQASSNWWAPEVVFADADGNILDPSQMCREQKVTRVLGRISRNDGGESIPFDFAIDRLKPWAEKNP